jgi:hypothetical protein
MAWAMLARLHSLRYFWSKREPSLREAAQKSLETALRLSPIFRGQLAQAFYQYWVSYAIRAPVRVLNGCYQVAE